MGPLIGKCDADTDNHTVQTKKAPLAASPDDPWAISPRAPPLASRHGLDGAPYEFLLDDGAASAVIGVMRDARLVAWGSQLRVSDAIKKRDPPKVEVD